MLERGEGPVLGDLLITARVTAATVIAFVANEFDACTSCIIKINEKDMTRALGRAQYVRAYMRVLCCMYNSF